MKREQQEAYEDMRFNEWSREQEENEAWLELESRLQEAIDELDNFRHPRSVKRSNIRAILDDVIDMLDDMDEFDV